MWAPLRFMSPPGCKILATVLDNAPHAHSTVAILELKKWGGHCGAKEKSGGNINVYLVW